MRDIRSLLFGLYQIVITVVWAVLVLVMCWLPARPRFRFISVWCQLTLWGARAICGIGHRVIGAENIPSGDSVICTPLIACAAAIRDKNSAESSGNIVPVRM